MKLFRKSFVAIMIIGVVLFGCSKTTSNSGDSSTRATPHTVGNVVLFDSMDSGDEYDSYKVELTLLDTVRGKKAQEIFDTQDNYPLKEDEEFLIAKFHINVLETKNDKPLKLSWNDITMFELVSEKGESYPYFTTRQHVEQNLFNDLYAGGSADGHLFFIVNKTDENPLITFNSWYTGAPWWKTSIPEIELAEDNRIDLDDWTTSEYMNIITENEIPSDYDIQQEKTELVKAENINFSKEYGGSLNNPVPVGNWIRYNHYSSNNEISIEMAIDEILTDEKALRIFEEDSRNKINEQLSSDEQLVAVRLSLNLLKHDRTFFSGAYKPYIHDFEIIDNNGKIVDDVTSLRGLSSPLLLEEMHEGGSQTGWLLLTVPTDRSGYRLSYVGTFLDSTRIWMSLDSDYVPEKNTSKYQYTYDASQYNEIDKHEPKGSQYNPLLFGESYKYKPLKETNRRLEELLEYNYSLKITDIKTDKEEISNLVDSYYGFRDYPEDKKWILFQVHAKVNSTPNDTSMKLSYSNFSVYEDYILSSPSNLKSDLEINELYPGNDFSEGYYIAFVDEDTKSFDIVFSSDESKAEVWFRMNLDSIPQ